VLAVDIQMSCTVPKLVLLIDRLTTQLMRKIISQEVCPLGRVVCTSGFVLPLWRKALVRVTAAPPSYVFPWSYVIYS